MAIGALLLGEPIARVFVHLPWFELYDEDRGALEGAARLAAVKSVKELDAAKSDAPQQSDDPVGTPIVKKLWASLAGAVRDGDW